MSLDTATLFTVATCVTGLLGIFIIGVWMRERSTRALAWWGTAYLVGGVAIGLWSVQSASPLPNALLFVACGMIWNGARLFHGRAILPGGLFAGAVVWIAAMQLSGFAASGHWRVILSSLVVASYTFLTASELQGRRTSDKLWLAPFMPLLHGVIFLLPIPATLLTPPGVSADSWFALFTLQTLLYAVAAAFIIVIMAQERVALGHKAEAMTDPLTGLLNRRGIFECGQQLTMDATRKPVSVLVIDLDRFKSINDRFGHVVGDEVLRLFAKTARNNTRGSDVLGRLGGDEFAAILPGGPPEAAMIGERLRAAFEAAADGFSPHRVGATVSIGVASAYRPADINMLLDRADAALYVAKANGRNRVESAADEMPAEPAPMPPTQPDSIRGGALAHLNPA